MQPAACGTPVARQGARNRPGPTGEGGGGAEGNKCPFSGRTRLSGRMRAFAGQNGRKRGNMGEKGRQKRGKTGQKTLCELGKKVRISDRNCAKTMENR